MRQANERDDGSTAKAFDPGTAPDLSKDPWPEKFAKAPVRRGSTPKARPEVTTKPPRAGL